MLEVSTQLPPPRVSPGGSVLPIKPAPAVLRAMDVLECLAVSGPNPPTMSEIARRTGQSKATCHSVLLALVAGGYVRRDPRTLSYSLGPGLISLGALASSALHLPEVAQDEMERLSGTLGVTTAAAIASGTSLVVLSAAGPPQPFQSSLPVGQRVPFAPPLGAAFIAWASESEIEQWLDRAPRPLSDGEREHFAAALATVRQHGYSVTLNDPAGLEFAAAVEEVATHPESREARARRDQMISNLGTSYLPVDLESGRTYRLTQVSAPVFDHDGAVVLVILGIAVGLELGTEQIAAYGESVRLATQRLTVAIAGNGA
jgi:DNA-binding IclR family transcriptional regulator